MNMDNIAYPGLSVSLWGLEHAVPKLQGDEKFEKCLKGAISILCMWLNSCLVAMWINSKSRLLKAKLSPPQTPLCVTVGNVHPPSLHDKGECVTSLKNKR